MRAIKTSFVGSIKIVKEQLDLMKKDVNQASWEFSRCKNSTDKWQRFSQRGVVAIDLAKETCHAFQLLEELVGSIEN